MFNIKLKNKNQKKLYILVGDQFFLLEKIIQKILFNIRSTEKIIHYKFYITSNINWTDIFNKFYNFDLFNAKIHILLIFPEKITIDMHQNLSILTSLLKQSNILTICINQITNLIKNQVWFKNIKNSSTIIDCNINTQKKFSSWVRNFNQILKISIDVDSEIFLFKIFKKNTYAALKLLEKFSILFPDQLINLSKIEKIVNSELIYTVDQLISVVFQRNINLSIFILSKIKMQKIFDPLIILRKIQNKVVYIIKIKENLININDNKICQKNYKLILDFSEKISINQLNSIINLMLILEIILKKSGKKILVWHFFNEIILILCGYHSPITKIYEKKINFNCFLRRYF
ncbi:DNA polymerase III subunit delta [Wigglesworthia glossinidia]|nr:DNA polymerase III subunit delta [Wigglesworthia glossinidia]